MQGRQNLNWKLGENQKWMEGSWINGGQFFIVSQGTSIIFSFWFHLSFQPFLIRLCSILPYSQVSIHLTIFYLFILPCVFPWIWNLCRKSVEIEVNICWDSPIDHLRKSRYHSPNLKMENQWTCGSASFSQHPIFFICAKVKSRETVLSINDITFLLGFQGTKGGCFIDIFTLDFQMCIGIASFFAHIKGRSIQVALLQ